MKVLDAAALESALGQPVKIALVIGTVMQGTLDDVDWRGDVPSRLHLTSGGTAWTAPWDVVTMVWTEEGEEQR